MRSSSCQRLATRPKGANANSDWYIVWTHGHGGFVDSGTSDKGVQQAAGPLTHLAHLDDAFAQTKIEVQTLVGARGHRRVSVSVCRHQAFRSVGSRARGLNASCAAPLKKQSRMKWLANNK